jgi:hypothetical protein
MSTATKYLLLSILAIVTLLDRPAVASDVPQQVLLPTWVMSPTLGAGVGEANVKMLGEDHAKIFSILSALEVLSEAVRAHVTAVFQSLNEIDQVKKSVGETTGETRITSNNIVCGVKVQGLRESSGPASANAPSYSHYRGLIETSDTLVVLKHSSTTLTTSNLFSNQTFTSSFKTTNTGVSTFTADHQYGAPPTRTHLGDTSGQLAELEGFIGAAGCSFRYEQLGDELWAEVSFTPQLLK